MPDVFISHASDDADEFVRPLAQALTSLGLDIRHDGLSLEPGGVRESIEAGLEHATIGVVVLSRHLLAVHRLRDELEDLFATDAASAENALAAICHDVTRAQVASMSPTLAGRVAIPATDGIEGIAVEIDSFVARRQDRPPQGWLGTYRDQTVNVDDLPRSSHSVVSRLKFLDCVIEGPGLIIPGADATIRDSRFQNAAQFCPIEDERAYAGAITVTHCYFERCSFVRLAIGMAASQYASLMELMKDTGPA